MMLSFVNMLYKPVNSCKDKYFIYITRTIKRTMSMTFPFFTTGFTGWRPSYINFDMCSTNPMNSLNIMWNAALERSKAQSMVYMYPAFNMSNFTTYFNGYDNSYLTNPFYSMSQVLWNNNNGQTGNLWNNINTTNNWSNPWGNMWNPSGTTPSADKPETAEEIGAKRKYNKILGLIKQLKEYEKVSNSDKDQLEAALEADRQNTKGTWTEKYNALKEAYDKISDSTVKECLKQSMELGTEEKPDQADAFRIRLESAGFEYEAGSIDEYIGKLANTIQNLSASQPNGSSDAILGGLDGKTVNILDVLSSWNTQYKNSETKSKKRLITFAAEKYNSIEDKTAKTTYKSTVLDPVVNALRNKANELAANLEGENKEKLQKAIKALDDAYDKVGDNVPEGVTTAFDNLYVLTRLAAIREIANDAKSYYGEVDSDLFNSDLFMDETIADLKAEGFSEKNITSNQLSVDAPDAEPASAEEEVKKLTETKVLETLDKKVKIGQKEYVVYREAQATGDRKYQRLFIIEDNKLKELTNYEYKDGKYTKINADIAVERKEIEASSIQSDYDAKQAKIKDDMIRRGRDTIGRLKEWTNEKDTERINQYLTDINKDNVTEFLKGVMETGWSTEGLMEIMDDDNAGNKITVANKRKLVQAIIDRAKEDGLCDDSTCKWILDTLQDLLNKCKDSDDKTGFNIHIDRSYVKECNRSYGEKIITVNWFCGPWCGNGYTINEIMDVMIKLLWEKGLNPSK